MTTYTEKYSQSIGGHFVDALSGLVQRWQHWVSIQQLKANVHRERQQLLEMSDATLGDLGITWDQAQEEARKVNLPVARIEMLNRKAL